MSRGGVYGPADYDAMFADATRTPAYLAAIAQVVDPTDVVVEIGTGVGYFAVAAARAGARHVYAIEREAAVVLAERVVHENGLSDRITCLHGDANRVALPERGTVLISDLRGALPILGDAIPTIVAARERLLLPHARLIPRRDRIVAAPCVAPRNWAAVESALGESASGISRRALAAYARARLHRDRLGADSCCAAGVTVATLDYATIVSPDVDAMLEWTVERAAQVAGIGLWFDADLADGARFSTAPGGGKSVYGHGFLPFDRALGAARGDHLSCHFRAKLVDETYVLSWDTVWRPASGGTVVTMRQSSLGSMLATPADRARRSREHRPDAAAPALIGEMLALVDGRRSLGEIADAMLVAHPMKFAGPPEALAWVTRQHAAIVAASDGR